MVVGGRGEAAAPGGPDRRQRSVGVQAMTGAGGMSDLYNTDCAEDGTARPEAA
jgi:hypothetical protein